jgi:UDP-N-acetylmuramate dehydrogenase
MIIQRNVSLRKYSNYKIGGIAKYFLDATSIEQLKKGLLEWKNFSKKNHKGPLVFGSGTNLLIDDNEYDELVIFNNIQGIRQDGDFLIVGSGVLISKILEYCVKHSLSGLEWAGGLPGTVGGAVRGNAGAFGGEIKDNIQDVKSINKYTLEEKTRKNTECTFSYRDSIFKSGSAKDEIVSEVTFLLKRGNGKEIKKIIDEKIKYRNERHPLEYPNIGSTFKNIPLDKVSNEVKKHFKDKIKDDPIPVFSAARFINLAGLRGKRIGDAQFSEKHPNFIVNLGNAKAKDVKELIALAKVRIKEKFDIGLEEEINYL